MAEEDKQVSFEGGAEQPKQMETASAEIPASAEPKTEKEEDDAAAKARERRERFKALQARAVSYMKNDMIFMSGY